MKNNFVRSAAVMGIIVVYILLVFSIPCFANEKTYVIKLGHSSPPNSIKQQFAEKFAEEAERLSNGKIEVKIFPSSQLGNIRDMIEGLRMGTVQVVIDPPSRLSVYTSKSKLADIFKMPFLFRDRNHGEKVWSSTEGKELLDRVADESEIMIIAMAWRGSRHLISTRPVYSPDDLKGLKIRVPPYDPPLTTWKVLGASPIPMDWGELFLGIQQGTVDALENPLEVSYTSGFSEICKYITLTGHNKEFNGFMVGKKYFESLPSLIQLALKKAAQTAAKYGGDLVESLEGVYLQKYKDDGCEIIETDISKWEEKVEDWKYEYAPQITPIMKKFESI
ncbi:Sialic acid-binding periplasmic protein SiaP [subsurface metagenome]